MSVEVKAGNSDIEATTGIEIGGGKSMTPKSLVDMSTSLGGEKEKRSNLGRGLAALFGETSEATTEGELQRVPKTLPLEHLHPNRYQPRRHFDATTIAQLADSIRENGILQPILVRPHQEKTGEYEIVAGERRWRAAQKARVHDVPVVIRDLSDAKALEIAVLENIQRQDLLPLEEAEGYRRLMVEFAYTQDKLAQTLGKSRSYIANSLRLLSLPDAVKKLLDGGDLTAGHARALVTADDAESLAKKIVSEGLSVRQTEQLVHQLKPASSGGKTAKRPKGSSGGATERKAPVASLVKDADTLALERDVSALLGLQVTIAFRGTNEDECGSLTIHYDTLEQLDDVLRRLNQAPEHDPITAGL